MRLAWLAEDRGPEVDGFDGGIIRLVRQQEVGELDVAVADSKRVALLNHLHHHLHRVCCSLLAVLALEGGDWGEEEGKG